MLWGDVTSIVYVKISLAFSNSSVINCINTDFILKPSLLMTFLRSVIDIDPICVDFNLDQNLNYDVRYSIWTTIKQSDIGGKNYYIKDLPQIFIILTSNKEMLNEYPLLGQQCKSN